MIQVVWANSEKTVLLMTFGYRWSRADFWNACQTAYRKVSSVDHTVDVIVDLSRSYSSVQNIVYLALSGMRMSADNTGKVVIISSSNLWLRLYHYIKRVYPADVLPVEFVAGYGEAMRVLEKPFFVDGSAGSQLAYQGQSVAPFTST